MVMRNKPTLSIAQKLAAGGNLTIDEFAAWAGISRVTVYSEISKGNLTVSKVSKRTLIAASDARSWQEARRQDVQIPEVA